MRFAKARPRLTGFFIDAGLRRHALFAGPMRSAVRQSSSAPWDPRPRDDAPDDSLRAADPFDPFAPHGGGDPVFGEQGEEERHLLASRLRAAIAIITITVVGMGVALDPAVHPELLGPLLAIKGSLLLVLAWLWRVQRSASRRQLIRGAIVTTIAAAATGGVSSAMVGEDWSGIVLALMMVSAAAALLPWGMRAQLIAAPVMMAFGSAPMVMHGTPEEARFTVVVGAIIVIGSVIVAREQDRYRRWAWQRLRFLREHTERLRQIADHINGVLWLGELGEWGETFLYVSPRYDDVWGLDRRALDGRPRAWLDAVHPDDRRAVEDSFRAEAKRGTWAREYRVLRPDGEIRWIRDAVFPIPDPEGRTRRIARLSQDTTAEREVASAKLMRELAHSIQSTREEERRRIARELHDELGQALTGIKLSLAGLALSGPEPGKTAAPVRACLGEIDGAMTSVHHMIHRLHPPILDDVGLCAALRDHVSAFGARTGVACTLDIPDFEPAVSNEERTALFRIAQESLTNVARHSQASSANVSVQEDGAVLRLVVSDDGRGIDGAAPGFGVRGMAERATLLGGTLAVEPRPGGGTRVRLEVPREPKRKTA